MNTFSWQLQTPLDAILFDCDGTLTSIEGIDELANIAGVDGSVIQALTAQAMGKTGLNPDLYQKRLEFIQPTKMHIDTLGKKYFDHRTPYADSIIALLKKLNKQIYIISAGLKPAVCYFGERLQLPQENIFAVDIQFDKNNHYLDFDHSSPLIDNKGKRMIVQDLKKQHQHMLYVGDGLNDVVVKDLVTRFVGYGGVYYRKNIAEQCDYYIDTLSLLPLLPLALTASEVKTLSLEDKKLYEEGMKWEKLSGQA